MGHGFDVPRGKKDELTPYLTHKHSSSDLFTGSGVDMTDDTNTTGIFRREYQYKNEAGTNVTRAKKIPLQNQGRNDCIIKLQQQLMQ
jgi:hypothetical protein